MYFVKDYKEKGYDAGSKARLDCEEIMHNLNYQEVNFYLEGRKIYYTSILKRNKELKKLNPNDKLIIQYPYHIKYWKSFFNSLQRLRKKNIKIVAIVHDIISLRTDEKDITIDKEIDIFNRFDYIVSHNKKMTKFLIENGVKSEIIDLNIFDYLIDNEVCESEKDFRVINIAGNLDYSKSTYIYIDEFKEIKSKVNLYGPNFNHKKIRFNSNNIEFKGCFKPEELGTQIKTGFGLVWDGEKIDSCSGTIGEYLKYNNPHKTSMYLSIGIPVIIWNKAAMADFIKANNLGIVINSLNEIDEILNKMTVEEYREIQQNCIQISSKIRTGYFLSEALKKI